MDPYPARRPRPLLRSNTSASALGRTLAVYDFADLDSFREDTTGVPMQARRSLPFVSLQSDSLSLTDSTAPKPEEEAHSHAGTRPAWLAFPGSPSSEGYKPVPSAIDSFPPARQGRTDTHRHHDAIPDEEQVDNGHVNSASPSGDTDVKNQVAPAPDVPVFDLTSVLGPPTKADEDFVRALQEQEAQGKLTGGLGLGIKTDMTVTGSALLAASPLSEWPRNRTLSLLGRPPSRAETVKRLGQNEANKRGEVIEVVMDNDSSPHTNVDLSLVSGQALAESGPFLKQTTSAAKSTTEVFYPQPNWKPFSMRWPYLLSLMLLSLGLGAGVEVLYRSSARNPLVTFRSPSEIPASEYFAVKFLPMLVAVSYGVLWQATNFDVMRLEAFYQLSKEGGALAAESINVDYLTQFNLFRPFRALYLRHYAVAVSTVASLLANTLVPTLGAACLVLTPDRDLRIKLPEAEKSILIHHVWSRLLTVVFCIIAFLGFILFYQLQTRRSGLLADVKGIAGIAAMATVSHILMDFKDMDVATHQDIHDSLKNHRYMLRNSSLIPDDLNPLSKAEQDKETKNPLSANPKPLMLRSAGALSLIAAVLLFTVLIPIVLFTPATALTDRAPWLMTAVAVFIKLSWAALETDVRMTEPYYILWRRHAPAKTLTLDYTAMPFGWVAVRGLLNGHWLVFFVGFGTVLAEILTVLVTSLATVDGRVFIALVGDGEEARTSGASSNSRTSRINAGQETVPSFWLSLAVAVAVLLYMGGVAAAVYARRRRVFLPRRPSTIASVLAYIHQSRMLYDFVGTAKFGNARMARWLGGLGKTYGLGWFRGRDGRSHCGVDEEELLSGFKAGYDYSRATKPWEEGEVNWL